MKYQIAIVDDNEIIREQTKRMIEAILPQTECKVRSFGSGSALLMEMSDGSTFDIYFLDIEMPEIDGLALAKKIRENDREGILIFLTSYEKYALQGYEIHAYGYVIKSEMEQKLPEIIRQAQRELDGKNSRYYIIETANRFEKILYEDILYIYKKEKNCIFVTNQGEHRERIGIEETRRKLGAPEFIYVDKGQLVNVNNITKIVQDTICFPDGSNIRISRANIKKVKLAVSAYWRERI